METVEAIEFGGGELASGTYFVRIIYRCPLCHRKHKQLINGAGLMPVEVTIRPTCGGSESRVVAWHSADYQKTLDTARSRAQQRT